MKKPTLILLILALLAAIAGAIYVPQLFGDTEAPVIQWTAADEVDGSQDETDPAESAGAEFERTAAEVEVGAPLTDNEPRISAILRGRVVNKSRQPVAGAKVWLEIGRASQGRGGRGRGSRPRRIPEPVITNNEGLFAFQGDAFRNLRVSLQVKHTQYAVGLFTEEVGDILINSESSSSAEVGLADLVLKSGGRVVGRVVDLDDNPVANAEVTMEPAGRNPLRWQRNRSELLPPIRTDNNGYYIYPNVPAATNPEFSVSVLAKMHTPGRSQSFQVADENEFVVPDIRLGPGFEATGFVRDERGNPIANANVTMRSTRTRNDNAEGSNNAGRGERGRGGRGRQAFAGRGRDHRTKSDETGRFFLEHLPGSMMEVRTNAKGFLNYEQDGIDVKLGQLIQIAMADGLRITGTVQTPNGVPVTSYAMRSVRLRGLPDPNLPNLDINELMAQFRSGNIDQATQDRLREQMRSLRDRGGRGGDRGDRGNRGRGGDRGSRGRGDDNAGEAKTHSEGKFVADGLQEGVYQIIIEAPDYARYQSQEIEVRHSTPAPDMTIALDPGIYVAGVVVDDRGNPIANAEVEMRTSELEESTQAGGGRNGDNRGRGFDFARMAQSWMRGRNGTNLQLDARTDEDGLFVFTHVPRGVFQLTAKATGFTDKRGEPFQLDNNKSDFELLLQPLGSIVGTVTGFRAEELGEVSVGAVMLPESGGMPNMFGGRGGRGGSSSFKTGKVEADGSYRLDGLATGNYVVRSWIGSTRQLMQQLGPDFITGNLVADVNVRGGKDTEWNMALTRPLVGIVQGTVRHNGNNATGFSVELRKKEPETTTNESGGRGWGGLSRMFGRNKNATVSASGEFSIKDVPAGLYELRISASRRGGVLLKEPLQVFGDDVLVRAYSLQTGSLKGTLTAEAGVDIKTIGGRVSVVPNQVVAPTENLGTWLRENGAFDARVRDGAFSFENVPGGSYLLVMQARNRAVTTQPVVVVGEEVVTVPVGAVVATPATNGNAPRGPGGGAQNGRRGGGNRRGR